MAVRIIRKERQEKYVDHSALINRDLADQHPIVAITGLQQYLDGIYHDISTIGDTIASNLVIGGNANVPYIISETSWSYNNEQKVYYYTLTHTMKSEDVSLNFYNELKHNIDVEVDYEILNDSSITIYVDSPKYVKAILNGYLNINLAGLKTIRTTDFLDDINVTSNKSWSSYQIMKMLAGYVTKSDSYTKTQMSTLFSLKSFEHGHENKDVLDGFSVNKNGDLLYNLKPVLRNIEPVVKTLTWDKQTNEIFNLILDTYNVFKDIQGIFISGSEFIIKNEDDSPISMKVTDGDLEVLNVDIGVGDTQKYLLGTSPNLKVYVKGIYTARYTVEALSEIDNLKITSPLIDNYSVSQSTTWASEKIQQEIAKIKTGVTLQHLDDVVMTEKKDNMILAYSSLTDKFVAVDIGSLSITGTTGNEVQQINVSNSDGTPDDPYIVEIPISSIDFKFNKVNVLKLSPKLDDYIKTLNSFTIVDKNDFIAPNHVIIDNGIKFDTEYEYIPVEQKICSEFAYSLYNIDLTDFKSVQKIEVDDTEIGSNNKIELSSIPNDSLVVQQKDINLSMVEHIDYFKIVGSCTNTKVIVSADSGVTWKTFNGSAWIDIKLDVDSIKSNGMTIDTFNTVVNATAWNELLNNSVRFAYLISQEDLNDIENIIRLEAQYDTFYSWVQAKDLEYDVIYVSNSTMKVLLYFKGDAKINF